MPKKFKEAGALVQTVTNWICLECNHLNTEEWNRIGYKKRCEECLKFFMLVEEKS